MMSASTPGSASATAAQQQDWRAKAFMDKRFMLTPQQKKQQEKLKQHLPRVHNTISKVANATGYVSLAIVTDDTPKRPVGKQAKKQAQMATTFHAIASSADVASGATGAQAKDVLIGQLESMVKELKKPTTQVKFVKPPTKKKKAKLIDKHAAIVAPQSAATEE